MTTIHSYDADSGEVYDITQTDDAIHDGDVVVALRETPPQAAVLVRAWPVYVGDHPGEPGSYFDQLLGGDWAKFEDGKYADSAALARTHLADLEAQRVANNGTEADEIGEWLDCGCHRAQREHLCGPREIADYEV